MPFLKIHLLGGLNLYLDGRPLTGFKSRKAEALIAYLACQPRPFPRQALAAFFWQESEPAQAAANLRKLLTDIRRHLADFLLVDRSTVAFNTASDYWLDVQAFLAGVESVSATPSTETTAADLYQGDFLAGFYLRDSHAFDEWAALERERLHLTAVSVLEALATGCLHQRRYARGVSYATRLLAIDPLHEEAHRLLMRLLARDGRRSAALAQFADCQRTLARELGVTPQPETTAVATRIRRALPQPVHFPTHFTPFVGREQELAQISRLLDDDNTRLLTLQGLGGVGKTRLALQVAADLITDFEHGVYFLGLAGIRPEFLLSTLNSLLRVPAANKPPRQQLLDFLRPKHCLLVLDNLEDALPEKQLLADMLQAAPQVQLLSTSRERLDLPQEQIVLVKGLDFPATAVSLSEALTYDAVQLFLKQAQRARPHFALTPDNLKAVLRLCRLLEGLPLGLDLAAAATRAFSPAQVATQIQQDLDFLSSRARDVPARHRSLRAVFDQSWRLLTPAEKESFSQLTVFCQGFTAQAARAVAGLTSATLQTLLDKSLLRQVTSHRYEMHELVRQFAAAQLAAAGQDEATRQRHADYFCRYVQAQETSLAGQNVRAGLEALGQELENIHAAWQWSAAHRRLEALAGAAPGLARYYLYQGPFQEGIILLQQAVAHLAPPGPPPEPAIPALIQLHLGVSHLQNRLGSPDEAVAAAKSALSLAANKLDPADEVAANLQIGLAAWHKSEHRAAQAQLARTLGLAQTHGLKRLQGDIQTSLGIVNYFLGDFDTAVACYEAALALHRECSNRPGEGRTLHNLGIIFHHRDDIPRAEAHYRQGLDIAQEVNDQQRVAAGYLALSNLYVAQGDFDRAQAQVAQALAIRHHMGDRQGEWDQIYRAHILQQIGDFAAARQAFEATAAAMQTQADTRKEAWALAGLALLHFQTGAWATAVAHCDRAWHLAQTQDPYLEGAILTTRGHCLVALNRLPEAEAAYRRLFSLRQGWGEQNRACEALVGLAHVAWQHGRAAEAATMLEPVLAYLAQKPPGGLEDPGHFWWTGYQILHAAGDGRAPDFLQQAQRFLQTRAQSLADPAARRRYLYGIPPHRALMEAAG